MELLELILFLLVAVVASSLLDQVLHGVSLPLVQIILGVIVALVIPLPSSINLDAELLLILFIAPLHFNESRRVDSGELYQNRFGIASLVTGLVLLTMIAMGATLNALIPAIPLAAALAFGAAMGSTDAAAVTALAKEMRFGRRHEALLNGEALFNDVTGTIGFQCAIAVVVSGAFSLTHAGEEFALELFGGLFVGALLGFAFWGLTSMMRRYGLDNPTVHVVLELLTPFIIYLICEQIHVGGVIAVVMAGMTISLLPHKRTIASSRQRLQASSVWKTLEFVLNGVIFVVLGIQLPSTFSNTKRLCRCSPAHPCRFCPYVRIGSCSLFLDPGYGSGSHASQQQASAYLLFKKKSEGHLRNGFCRPQRRRYLSTYSHYPANRSFR